jgi:pyochelin biosynthetic protein PchC
VTEMGLRHLDARVGLTATWLRRLGAVARPAMRLVCFPHAGGTAPFYRPWRDHLPPDLELYAVQYPGRMDRIADPLVDDMDLLADSVAMAVRPLLDCPLAFFGHSLGAIVAYEVARRLCARSPGSLVRLFVSAREAPDRQRPGVRHLASDDVLWGELARLGGTRPGALTDPDLRAAFLPALRSDYRLAECYQPHPGPLLDCPVTVLLGEQDSDVGVAETVSWAAVTWAGFSIRTFPGEHFYLIPRIADVTGEITQRLTGQALPAYPGWAGP